MRSEYPSVKFGSVRFASLAAIGGAVVGLLLTPPMAAVWAYDPPFTRWASMATWVERTFGPTLESWEALSFGRADLGPYEVYGKGFLPVYLAMIPIVRLVHQQYRSRGGDSRWELWTWRVMWASLIVAAIGDFTSYWGGVAAGRDRRGAVERRIRGGDACSPRGLTPHIIVCAWNRDNSGPRRTRRKPTLTW